ncbi:NRDE family protein [Halioxenophilus sp. WMMB6]|uniref:NRDE family protein n=1 Tax=Halioxenophilus sp. WMMB6 TaxID=3073815 RepID=UPI00295EB09B|nr:NRDE family protein [Halioxenophilus sp. WMMB6]
MCLIFIAYQQHPEWPLIIASNRDEFFQRASLPGHFWAPQFNLLGGRDQEQGGTWLAVNRNGRFAAVTNFRDPKQGTGTRSRGFLVHDFVAGEQSPADYLQGLTGTDYTGFNLLLGSVKELYYGSNRGRPVEQLSGGIYGLSNHLLDTPWPKVVNGKLEFTKLVQENTVDIEGLFNLMGDTEEAASGLPETGIGEDQERYLSSRFIPARRRDEVNGFDGYGTRTTTIVLMNRHGGGHWLERNHNPEAPNRTETLAFQW